VTAVGHTPTPPLSGIPGDLAAFAAEHGLHKVGGRPPLLRYAQQTWQRRHFVVEIGRGQTIGAQEGSRLGLLWELLTPILWALLYWFIFGYIIKTSRGIENFAVFLVSGLFMFRFVSGCMQLGSRSIKKNISLITSLQFPRALVPMSTVVAEVFSLVPSLAVLFALTMTTGEPLRWQMLLLIPTVALMCVFSLGLALAAARLVFEVPDLDNIIPFVIRALMYTSGVFFSIEHFAGDGTLGQVLAHQPLAIYIELCRSALLEEVHVRAAAWLWAVGWAVVGFGLGFIYFWRAEAKYGRG